MDTVKVIIEQHGGLARLKFNPIKVVNPPFMDLCIEYVGCEYGGFLVSVAHYYEQSGDLVADPEVVILVKDDTWTPISYSQPGMGVFYQAMYTEDGKVMVRPQMLKELKRFCSSWSRNLRSQWFIKSK
ncbi:MAG: hypothetical protein U0871_24265 [Gemmataceae bacterium]